MHHHHHHHSQLPCLQCHPQSYIRMVQHLIERCLILRMNRDDCVQALAQHACIRPLVTLAVWKGLLKENKGFFQSYLHEISPRHYSSYKAHGRFSRFGNRKQRKCHGI
ncbi:Angiotensin-converting enzyme 2 protein [Dioscorea alata]|uniref:Angiotensin-converting enzyme 2 protein n=1 Tax=Dioscorea alata TaxID=55571 RepID=A0ACB7U2W4_DIOAL|nr:Angiotensin-converting enzyme 2 protein [Dioscorea alata]